jgi:hypothetical protein
VNHAAAEHFKPSRLLANWAALALAKNATDQNFGARFSEGEVMGSEANLDPFAEKALSESVKRSLQISKGHILVNEQTFNLVEDGGVGSVKGVATINPTGRNNPDRWLPAFHHANLHSRCLRPQQNFFARLPVTDDIETVVVVAGWMFRRDVQRYEVVPLVFDLRSLNDLKTQIG